MWDNSLEDVEYGNRVNDWIEAMVKVMETLKEKGVFAKFDQIFINAEFQPPEDDINVKNAMRLNSELVFLSWYKENKDEYEE